MGAPERSVLETRPDWVTAIRGYRSGQSGRATYRPGHARILVAWADGGAATAMSPASLRAATPGEIRSPQGRRAEPRPHPVRVAVTYTEAEAEALGQLAELAKGMPGLALAMTALNKVHRAHIAARRLHEIEHRRRVARYTGGRTPQASG